MATLSASVSGKTVNWQITGLGYPFDTRQYQSAGLCLVPFSDGASSISGVLDTVYPVTYQAATPPTYGSRLFDSGSPVQVWVAQSGYTGYTFNSSTGQYSYSGSYITLQPNQSGTLYTISGGGTFLERLVLSGGYATAYWYESYLISPGSPAEIGPYDIYDAFENAPVGTYYIYGWAKLQVNNLYYNAGSYQITVQTDGVVKIDLSSGWVNAVPYIDMPYGWVVPEVWIDTPSGWVKAIS